MARHFFRRFVLFLAVPAFLIFSASGQDSQVMPNIRGESLSNQQVELPSAASGNIAVLVLGFSKASKEPTNAWAKKLSSDFAQQPGFVLYQLPVLESVPRFVRGMVISSMRKSVAPQLRDHFVPLLNGESELKKLVGYHEPDDAYLILLDREGKIAAQTHGPLSEANDSAFRSQIQMLLKSSK